MAIPRRVLDRMGRGIAKYQQVLKLGKDRDLNEADTVFIIKDILAEVFGYDKYTEITSEVNIRSTFCDLAIKNDGKIEFLLEAKAIGTDLKDNHLRQAVNYGANNGIQWIVLTNGISWQLYKIRFEQPINHDLVCQFNLLELDTKNDEEKKPLFILCKEGLIKDAREEFCEKIETLNKFILGALLQSDEMVSVIRRELRKISDGILVDPTAISEILTNEVIKRDVLEGDDATKAQSKIKRFYNKQQRKAAEPVLAQEPGSTISV